MGNKPKVVFIDEQGKQREFSKFILVAVDHTDKDSMVVRSLAAVDGDINVARGMVAGIDKIREALTHQVAMQVMQKMLGGTELLKDLEGILGQLRDAHEGKEGCGIPDFLKQMMEREGSGRFKPRDTKGPAFPHMRSSPPGQEHVHRKDNRRFRS